MRRTLITGLLLSSMLFTAAAYASPSSDSASASTIRVSTGVTPPQVLAPLSLAQTVSLGGPTHPANPLITVSFTVDETGHTRNIQIVKGSDPYWNARVANAVQNLHYRPASMNNEPVAMDVTLNVTIAQ
jgi:hypothetical protein